VVYRVSDIELWIAPLDRRSPPRKLSVRQSSGLAVSANGDMFYTAQAGNGNSLYRVRPDGIEQKLLDLPAEPVRGFSVSPDGRWAAFPWGVYPLGGGSPVAVCNHCNVSWGPDGHSMLLHFNVLMGAKNASVILPYKNGALPSLPRASIGLEDAEKIPGAQVIASVGATVSGSSIAYQKVAQQANLFRITLP
jgi:hypothetical protein